MQNGRSGQRPGTCVELVSRRELARPRAVRPVDGPAQRGSPSLTRVPIVSDQSSRPAYPPSSDSTLCGVEFAVASTLVPACVRIWARVSAAVSAAKSASRMRALAGRHVLQRDATGEFMFVSSVFFSNAPSRPRRIATWRIAFSMIRLAAPASPPTSVAVPPVTRSLRNPTSLSPSLLAATDRCRCSPAGCW